MKEDYKKFIVTFFLGVSCIILTNMLLLWSKNLFEVPRYGPGLHPGGLPPIIALFTILGSIIFLPSSFFSLALIVGRWSGAVAIVLGAVFCYIIRYAQSTEYYLQILISLIGPAVGLFVMGISILFFEKFKDNKAS